MNTHVSPILRLMLVGILSVAVGLVTPTVVKADSPITGIIQVDETFINDFDCNFPLIEQVNGTYLDRHYFDQNGT